MNITIKQLQGGECNLQIDPKTKIIDVKKCIYTKLLIPVEEQKLLLMGRTLADDKTITSYPKIKDGTKLNLVVKKPEGLFVAAVKYFKQCGLTETEAKKAANKLLEVIQEKFNKLSWDDIEQMSLSCLINQSLSGDKLSAVLDSELDCNDSFGL